MPSSADFIEKASGIKNRHVLSKEGLLDPEILCPRLPERSQDDLSVMAEMAVKAGEKALEKAGRHPQDIDALIMASSNLERAYPSLGIEVQSALGTGGFAFDMSVACSTGLFGISMAHDLIRAGRARSVLVCTVEPCTGHVNFEDRASHFIFGDAAVATLVESSERASKGGWAIEDIRLSTHYATTIWNGFGFLNRTAPDGIGKPDKLFQQNGPKVFRDLGPLAVNFLEGHLKEQNLKPQNIRRFWLHQANIHMNAWVMKKVLGRAATQEEAPLILDEYANTAAAGALIAFHQYNKDLAPGDRGLLYTFGAGYSLASLLLKKTEVPVQGRALV